MKTHYHKNFYNLEVLVGRDNESVGDVKNYREDDKRVLLWELFDPLSELKEEDNEKG